MMGRAHLRFGVVRIGFCSVGLPPRADSSRRTRQEPRATKASVYFPMTPRMHRIADAPWEQGKGAGVFYGVRGESGAPVSVLGADSR